MFDHGAGRSGGEPVFVAPARLVGRGRRLADHVRARRANNDSAELVVLDAQDFDRGYVAQVLLPQRVPYGFHGNWVSDRSVPPPTA